MTDILDTLRAAREAQEKATPGEWTPSRRFPDAVLSADANLICTCGAKVQFVAMHPDAIAPNIAFICLARSLPLAEIAAVVEAATELSEVLDGGFVRCQYCDGQEDTTDIDGAAKLRAALAALAKESNHV